MYLYSLRGYEENIVLQHNKKFSKKEFDRMCKEAPIEEAYGRKAYDSITIKNHLINKYGFDEVNYVTGFFTDGEI